MKKTARAIVSSALSVLLAASCLPAAALAEVSDGLQQGGEVAAAETAADEGAPDDATVTSDDATTPDLLTVEENAFDYVTSDVAADPYSTVTNDGETASTNVQALVTQIEEAISTLSTTVSFTYGTYTVAELHDAMGLVIANPENYWLVPAYSTGYYDTDGVSGYSDGDSAASVRLTYLAADADELATMKTSMETGIADALSWVDADEMTQFEVVQALHDYLVRNCAYDTSTTSASTTSHLAAFTAYGALVDKAPVCQGYALAYKLLLSRLGISAVFVMSTSMNHSWNMVQMDDGEWYHVDVTYDDPLYTTSTDTTGTDGGFDHAVSHTYFLRSDTTLTNLGHHDWAAAYTTPSSDYALPEAGYGTYNAPAASAGTKAAASTEAAAVTYAHSESKTSGSVTFTVQWNDPVAGEDATFHVTATGGSDVAKVRMDVPTYYDSDGSGAESVCDPSRNSWGTYYTLGDEGHDFTFSFTASGKYYMLFYYMDTTNKVYYLRSNFFITIDDAGHPAVSTIVANAVAQAQAETDGSDYQMALWLHDWELKQLDYDYSLNYCSAESGLTRGKGTCESFERIYQKLLTKAGLENARMEGNGHTWNAVRIDGKWCQVDVNWDDDDGTNTKSYCFDATHLYFGLTDELMAKAHSDHATTYQADGYAYRSTDLSNNYFVRSGKAAEWAKAYAERIQAQLDEKQTSFTITSDNASLPPSINGIQNGIVAYAIEQQTWTTGGSNVTLTCTSNVTTESSTSWTAVYEFAAEYEEKTVSNEERFVRHLYSTVLDNDSPTDYQISYWTGELKNGIAPQKVALGFFQSAAYKSRELNNVETAKVLYASMHDDDNPTDFQITYWAGALGTDSQLTSAVRYFAHTAAYKSMLNSYGLETSPRYEDYVKHLYASVLGNTNPSDSQVTYWTNRLSSGTSPADIAKGFYASTAFSKLSLNPEQTAKNLYAALQLNESPTAYQVSFWATQIENGAKLSDVIDAFAQTNPYFNALDTYGL